MTLAAQRPVQTTVGQTTTGQPPLRPPALRRAGLYRMVMDDHVCPYGLKARDLLRHRGYMVDDRLLTARGQTEAFKAEHHAPGINRRQAGRRLGRPAPLFRQTGRQSGGFLSLTDNLMMLGMLLQGFSDGRLL